MNINTLTQLGIILNSAQQHWLSNLNEKQYHNLYQLIQKTTLTKLVDEIPLAQLSVWLDDEQQLARVIRNLCLPFVRNLILDDELSLFTAATLTDAQYKRFETYTGLFHQHLISVGQLLTGEIPDELLRLS